MSRNSLFEKYNELQARRADGEAGFTLIELLVVVVIIGILVAIAIPLYLNYEHGAENKSLRSDMRAAISAEAQCFADSGDSGASAYQAGSNGTNAGQDIVLTCATGVTETAKVSSGNLMTITVTPAAAPTSSAGYVIVGKQTDTGVIYKYDSSTSNWTTTGLTAYPAGT